LHQTEQLLSLTLPQSVQDVSYPFPAVEKGAAVRQHRIAAGGGKICELV